MDKNFNYLIKYSIIGDSSVGKSNLATRFIHDKFSDEYHPTSGVLIDSSDLNLEGKVYRIQTFDTAEKDVFKENGTLYYKNSACFILVYEINNRKSFENLSNWIENFKKSEPKTVLKVLVGNKCDLEEKREVSEEEGRKFAENNEMLLFFETSAKTGKNVEEVFKQSAALIAKRIEENFYDLESDICGIIKKDEKAFVLGKKMEKENKKDAWYL